MAMLFRRRPYTDASNRAASAFLLGTHPSLGARSPVLGLMERGPQCLTKIAPFLLEPRPLAMALSGCHDSTLRLWDLREGRCAVTLKGHRCRVHAVAADFGSMQALSGSGDNTLRLWDLREGRCTATLEGHGDEVTAVTADFGSMQALSGSVDPALRLWDLREGRCTGTLEGNGAEVWAVAADFGGLSQTSLGAGPPRPGGLCK